MNFEQDLSVFFWFVLQLFIQSFHISSLKITKCNSGNISLVESTFLWRPKLTFLKEVGPSPAVFVETKTRLISSRKVRSSAVLWHQNQLFSWEAWPTPDVFVATKFYLFAQEVGLSPAVFVATKFVFFEGSRSISSCFCGDQIYLFQQEVGVPRLRKPGDIFSHFCGDQKQ